MKYVKYVLLPLTLMVASLALAGCSGGTLSVKPFGTWSISTMTSDGLTMTSVTLVLTEGGTYSTSYLVGATPCSHSGTFSPASLPAGSDIAFTATYSTYSIAEPYAPPVGGTWYGQYINLTASTLDFYIDVATGGPGYEGPYTATRL